MTIEQYIDNINQRYKLGNATEHTFRGDLQQLIESLVPTIRATNEPKRQSCGAPDYILTKKDIPVGFIEAKDIGDTDLEGKKKTGHREQFDRYKASLSNLIFTDYLRFHLYHDGELITKIEIGEITDKGIKPLTENFASFENLIKDFCVHIGQTIKSPKKLAEMMAGKARLLSEIIEKALTSDEENEENSSLKDQMIAFKQILIHDITPKGFADVYAQTIAYGMFAARLHDTSLNDFSRQEAAELIPKSNPFLRKLFGYISGPDIDDRIKWIVDSLADIFLATNVEEILKNYGKSTKMEDPIIHFYETFLSEYDPKLRKARGVWYTPQPVVNFIVRAVDDILKSEFDLPQGLADTSKTTIKVDMQGKKVDQEVHKVQILDPATGTGTFLAEVVKHIHKKFAGQQGIWSNYAETHLLPRLNGFEILMASYAMAHLKLDLLLKETGFKPTKDQRFRVYLTNSLEEYHPDTGSLWATVFANEANEANHIKRDTPVMCVIGNPPYSGESSNQGAWIMNLMEDYKKEPGGKVKLKEKNSKWINDDYVKFLRYGQHFIEKNGSGVLAFINPHGFLDNPTFRGMRWNLIRTYDKIFTIDLHGNSNKKETAPDGSADINVFDIQQGVSINVFIKTGKKKTNELGKVFHYDLYGKRDSKYDFLTENTLKSIKFTELQNEAPMFFMVKKDFEIKKVYERGFNVCKLFKVSGAGIVSKRDALAFQNSKNEIKEKINDIYNLSYSEIETKYNFISWKSRDGKVEFCKDNVMKFGIKEELFVKYAYRQFDNKWTYYTGDSKGFIGWPVKQVMSHLLKDNVALIFSRQTSSEWKHLFISKHIGDFNITGNAGTNGSGYYFPLYLYPETNGQQTIEQQKERLPNLNSEIVKQIEEKLALTFTAEKETTENTFAPIDILDYIYAVLYSPTYRKKYNEFLKIDFPRVPYPKDTDNFWQLVSLGGEIRKIHLLESQTVENYITQYPIDGDNVVQKPSFENEKVYINDTQYFDNVPETSWNFFIGGYQPAQKWLKDRKDSKLEFDDILHYQKIIVALSETDRLMKEIDKIAIE
ncbi:type ISP restriction/modification enzyme [Prolixibacter denitrificans]|uniref:site-specific DNA-methyltransferase (adenine-specific) n=1 Tax=Prolixibacter denitrificans TaxID=1541063 RepID=A0A2P8C566_9BACT|nr:type ISP restriction/modification enzyme [Prolixibacter denitrificans]PSK80113.1 N-6 DNA methylase [Prolixibacter denitrificans]GET23043.1 DNA methyltransferase [Prolixibacter denitrificans]